MAAVPGLPFLPLFHSPFLLVSCPYTRTISRSATPPCRFYPYIQHSSGSAQLANTRNSSSLPPQRPFRFFHAFADPGLLHHLPDLPSSSRTTDQRHKPRLHASVLAENLELSRPTVSRHHPLAICLCASSSGLCADGNFHNVAPITSSARHRRAFPQSIPKIHHAR